MKSKELGLPGKIFRASSGSSLQQAHYVKDPTTSGNRRVSPKTRGVRPLPDSGMSGWEGMSGGILLQAVTQARRGANFRLSRDGGSSWVLPVLELRAQEEREEAMRLEREA